MAEKLIVDIEFKTNLQKATKDIEKVKESVNEINDGIKNLDDTGKKGFKGLGAGLKKLGKGFKGVGLAMKTLGVGLVLEAFKLLKDVFLQNQGVVDALAVATETMGVVFNQISSVISDVVDAVSKSEEGFEGLQKVMSGLLTIAITPLKLSFFAIKLGIQEAQLIWEKSFFGDGNPETIAELNKGISETKQSLVEVVEEVVIAGSEVASNLSEAVTEGMKEISIASALATGKALAEAKKNEELLEVLRAKQQLTSQLDAELQRQVRDDISKTFQERIDANNELGRILEDQIAKEKTIVDEKVRIAKLELSTQEESVALQVKYQQALLDQIDIDERIAGQQSEQLTNKVALEKELEETRQEVHLATMGTRQQELLDLANDYEAKKELARQSGESIEAITIQYNQNVLDANSKFAQEDLDNATKIANEKKALDQSQLNNISNTINMAGKLFNKSEKDKKRVATASAIMDTYKAVNMALASAPPPISYFQAGLSLVTGLKSIKEINKVKVEGGGSDASASGLTSSITSGGGGGSGGGSETLADLSGMPSITEQFNNQFGGGQSQPPIQAFVVEQQVTESQQINTMIQEKATL
jgi:hypothetical protein